MQLQFNTQDLTIMSMKSDKDFDKWLEEQGIDEEHNPLPEVKDNNINDNTYRELWYAYIGGEYDTMKNVKKDIHRLLKDEKITMKELVEERAK